MRRLTGLSLAVALILVVPLFLVAQSPNVAVDSDAQAQVHRTTGEVEQGSKAHAHFDNWVTITARHADGTIFAERKVHNLVTNAGFDLISKAVSDTATQPSACNWIAVTNTAITPAAGDTTLSGEIVTNGLTRAGAQGTFAHTNGQQTYTVTRVFTATGTQASQATGLFNASSTGTLCYEATYTQVTVNSGDTLTVTWTVTLS